MLVSGAASGRGSEERVPTVSVGLPVFNGARYLAEAVESILGQTLEDLELVISDNGSTDATEELCRGYAADDRRVRYVRQPRNRGASWNFNEVFWLSRGRYFHWHPHDDVLEPAFLRLCVEALEAKLQAA